MHMDVSNPPEPRIFLCLVPLRPPLLILVLSALVRGARCSGYRVILAPGFDFEVHASNYRYHSPSKYPSAAVCRSHVASSRQDEMLITQDLQVTYTDVQFVWT
ncbi:hypothetical protein C8R45DRAFT_1011552 [Mycena sanguinolenta]|nr:hypothetical protein C8R45DRAFT_1011552 [Mycena sanguinolenta]